MVQSFIDARTLTPSGKHLGPPIYQKWALPLFDKSSPFDGVLSLQVNTNLLFSDMRKPELVVEIAKQLRRFHEVEIPGSKEPQLWNDISKFFSRGNL